MAGHVVAIEDVKAGGRTDVVYEHPFIVRLCHWVNAVALFVLIGSGLQIFKAFPSFGAKIPQHNLINWPKSLTLGGWLGGALQWHLTFMWIYIVSGVVYTGYQLISGNYFRTSSSRMGSFASGNRYAWSSVTGVHRQPEPADGSAPGSAGTQS